MSTFGAPGSGRIRCSSASEIKAAAPPPTPLNSATICGIAVIFTLRAATAPNPPPISIASAIAHQLVEPILIQVTTIASSIPAAPIWLPRRACAGFDRNRSARMNVTIVTRYKRRVASAPTGTLVLLRLALLEHLEHPVGHDEAADHVRGGEHDGREPDHPGERALVGQPEHDHRPDDHDPVNRVRAAHQ